MNTVKKLSLMRRSSPPTAVKAAVLGSIVGVLFVAVIHASIH